MTRIGKNDSYAKFIIQVDKVLDYIPFVSTISNSINLVAQAALIYLAKVYPLKYQDIKSHLLVQHLKQKNSQCIFLAIPFLNIGVAFRRDFLGKTSKLTKTHSPQPPQPEHFQVKKRQKRESVSSKSESIPSNQLEIENKKLETEEERKVKVKNRLENMQNQIEACPDTVEGRKRRKLLEDLLQQTKKMSESYLSACSDIQKMFGKK